MFRVTTKLGPERFFPNKLSLRASTAYRAFTSSYLLPKSTDSPRPTQPLHNALPTENKTLPDLYRQAMQEYREELIAKRLRDPEIYAAMMAQIRTIPDKYSDIAPIRFAVDTFISAAPGLGAEDLVNTTIRRWILVGMTTGYYRSDPNTPKPTEWIEGCGIFSIGERGGHGDRWLCNERKVRILDFGVLWRVGRDGKFATGKRNPGFDMVG